MPKIIDACGRSCPEPVIMTKNALSSKEESYEVLVDNQTALGNVSRFAEHDGYSVQVKSDGEIHHLYLQRN